MWVVYFHNVLRESLDSFDRGLSRISSKTFASQVDFLRRNLHPISLPQMLEMHAAGEDDPRAVAITFDDGYLGVFNNAAPILAEARIPATVFLVSETFTRPTVLLHFEEMEAAFRLTEVESFSCDLLEESSPLDTPHARLRTLKRLKKVLKVLPESRRQREHRTILENLRVSPRELRRAAGQERFAMLGHREIEKLLAARWTMGGHTHTHRTLSCLPRAEQEREIRDCRDILRRCLGLSGRIPFAYPYGQPIHVGAEAPKLVAETGFTCALTTVARPVGPTDDPYLLPRLELAELYGALQRGKHENCET